MYRKIIVGIVTILMLMTTTIAVVDFSIGTVSADSNNGSFDYIVIDGGKAEITGYITSGLSLPLYIPSSIHVPNGVDSNGNPLYTWLQVASIGDSAFEGCWFLSFVGIPSTVTSIGENAFANTPLTSVTIPTSVSSLKGDAFYGCTALSAINVDSNNKQYSSIDGVVYSKDGSVLIEYPAGRLGAFSIPSGVTSIGEYAFDGCRSLNSVTIPFGVTSIGNDAFAYTSLTSVTIPNSVTSIGENAFMNCVNLAKIMFDGSAPTAYPHYASGDGSFTQYYYPTETGFTTPTWEGMPCYPIGGNLKILYSYSYIPTSPKGGWTLSKSADADTKFAIMVAVENTGSTDVAVPTLTGLSQGTDASGNALQQINLAGFMTFSPNPGPNGWTPSGGTTINPGQTAYLVYIDNNAPTWSYFKPDSTSSAALMTLTTLGLDTHDIKDLWSHLGPIKAVKTFASKLSMGLSVLDAIRTIWKFKGSEGYTFSLSPSDGTQISGPSPTMKFDAPSGKETALWGDIIIKGLGTALGYAAGIAVGGLTAGAGWLVFGLINAVVAAVTGLGCDAVEKAMVDPSMDYVTFVPAPTSPTWISTYGNASESTLLSDIYLYDAYLNASVESFVRSTGAAENGSPFYAGAQNNLSMEYANDASFYYNDMMNRTALLIDGLNEQGIANETNFEQGQAYLTKNGLPSQTRELLTNLSLLQYVNITEMESMEYTQLNGSDIIALASLLNAAQCIATADGDGQAGLSGNLFGYTVINNSSVEITGYIGSDANITIPEQIQGLPVTAIGNRAFDMSNISSIVIPGNVNIVGDEAFFGCPNLINMTFEGNAPSLGSYWALGSDNLTVYYQKGATGFTTPTWNGIPCFVVGTLPSSTHLQITVTANVGTTTGTGLYNAGSTATINATAPKAGAGEQYVWNGWVGTGTGSYTGMNNPASVTMNGAITEKANWTHRFQITMSADLGTTTPSVGNSWNNAGSTVAISAIAPAGGAYVFNGWTGTGTGSYTGANNSASVTVNGAIMEKANWTTQAPTKYQLTVTANFGTTTGTGPYNASSTVSIHTTAPTAGSGEQYVWNGWVGTGTGSYTGANNTASVTVNGAITETANWSHQFQLTMSANLGTTTPSVGNSWNSAGTSRTINATAPTGGTYVFNGWVGTGIGSYTGKNNPASVTMDGPITEKANWSVQAPTQYQLTVTANFGTTTGTGLYNTGSTVSISATAPATTTGVRYTFNGWVGTGAGNYTGKNNPASVTMNGLITEKANWTVQYLVTFKQSGLDSSAGTNTVLTVGSTNYNYMTMPAGIWITSGTTFKWSSAVNAGAGMRFNLTGNSGLASPISAPGTDTGTYRTQYQLNIATNFGTTNPVSGSWYNVGTRLTLAATAPIPSAGERYVFNGWTGTGTGSYTGKMNSVAITVNGPQTETASWSHQYLLTVVSAHGTPTPSSGNWINSGTVVTETVTSTANQIGGIRYACTGWGSGHGSIQTTGSGNSVTFTITSPSSLTWNWVTQYKVTFAQLGISNDFRGTVLKVDGTSYTLASLPVSLWWNQNSQHTFQYPSSLTDRKHNYMLWSTMSFPFVGKTGIRNGVTTITATGTGMIIGIYFGR